MPNKTDQMSQILANIYLEHLVELRQATPVYTKYKRASCPCQTAPADSLLPKPGEASLKEILVGRLKPIVPSSRDLSTLVYNFLGTATPHGRPHLGNAQTEPSEW